MYPDEHPYYKSTTESKLAPRLGETIWTFWNGNPPELVLRCIESMRQQNPHRQLIVLSKDTLPLFLSSEDYPRFHGRQGGPDDFSCAQYLSDWVRLTLLEKYGGVWLDASVICTNPVETWCQAVPSNDDQSSFSLEVLTMFPMHANPNIHGNWAMAVASPGHPLIHAWRSELAAVFDETGSGQIPIGYIERSFAKYSNLVDLWNNPSPPPLPYLWVYLALQVVLQQNPELHSTIQLLPSINGPMFRRYKLNVEQGILDSSDLSQATADHLANEPLCQSQHDRYFIKLVGSDRIPCQAHMDAKTFQTGSALEFLSQFVPRRIVYGKNLQHQADSTTRRMSLLISASPASSPPVRDARILFRTAIHAVLVTHYLSKRVCL